MDETAASSGAALLTLQAIDAMAMLAGIVEALRPSGVRIPNTEPLSQQRAALIPQSDYVQAAAAFLYYEPDRLEELLPAELVSVVRKYLQQPISKAAERRYMDQLWPFFEWCDKTTIDVAALDVEIVLVYFEQLFKEQGYGISIIKRAYAAINRFQKVLHGRPFRDERLTAALKRYKRERPPKKFRTPTHEEVDKLMYSLDPANPKQARDGAAIMIGLAGGLKPVRFPYLRWENTTFHASGGVSITFTDRKKKHCVLALSAGEWPTDPVAWLRRWKEHCKRDIGPIFVHVDAWDNYWNEPLKPPSVTQLLRDRLQSAGLPHLGMGFTGVRRGFLDGLASLDIEDTAFATLGMYERLTSDERFRRTSPKLTHRQRRHESASPDIDASTSA